MKVRDRKPQTTIYFRMYPYTPTFHVILTGDRMSSPHEIKASRYDIMLLNQHSPKAEAGRALQSHISAASEKLIHMKRLPQIPLQINSRKELLQCLRASVWMETFLSAQVRSLNISMTSTDYTHRT